MFRCPSCPLAFGSKSTLYTHKRSKHGEIGPDGTPLTVAPNEEMLDCVQVGNL